MIGVDTNVLLRFLLDDDPAQSSAARRFFAERSADDPAFLSLVTLIESVWVARRRLKRSDADVARMLRGLLGSDRVVIQHEQLVIRALRDTELSGADFADAVVAHLGVEAGCDTTVTLDRAAADLPGMIALPGMLAI